MTSVSPTLSNQLDKSWADRLLPALNALIADFEMLRFNVRSASWNGWGEHYPTMVDALPAYQRHAEQAVEMLAKRVRCMEGHPPSTLSSVMEHARISANDGAIHYRACMKMLRESLAHLLKEEREVLTLAQHGGDEVTAQGLTALMAFQEECL